MDFKKWFEVTPQQFWHLIRPAKDPEALNRYLLITIGIVLLPITLAGALLGYIRGYTRFEEPYDNLPQIAKLSPIMRIAMILGAVAIWGIILLILFAGKFFYELFGLSPLNLIIYLSVNLALTLIAMYGFRWWRNKKERLAHEQRKFGSARFAKHYELEKYQQVKKGFYIGGGNYFDDKGHILTVAGTRGGKGTSLIIPNLLGISDFAGSWVIIDPKGENCAVCSRYQGESGRKVVVLNPWDLLPGKVGKASAYNPLDLLSDKSSINLVDDVLIIAEMLVPIERDDKNRFFTDNARAIVAGLLLYIAVSKEKEERTLITLWEMVRYTGQKWKDLLADMAICDDPINGVVVKNASNEIKKLMEAGEDTFGNIIATVLQCTDFLKSPALQKSLQSGFDPYTLAQDKVALYIIIPADKLNSHYRWLRLVVTTCLRAVIRKPNKRVCFLLDEFAALGYLPEIETAMSTYAGYEVTIWPILQSLIQLKSQYGDNWETFTANSTIRHFFSVNDNFTAKYVSQAIGQSSYMTAKSEDSEEASGRPLVTTDELRRASGTHIFAFFENNPATFFQKYPYHKMPELMSRADENPYQ